MYKKIAAINVKEDYSIELGYTIPSVITPDTKVNVETKIISNKEIDKESIEYKQMESVAEVLRVGFDIGCAYTDNLYRESLKAFEEMEKGKIPANDVQATEIKAPEGGKIILE